MLNLDDFSKTLKIDQWQMGELAYYLKLVAIKNQISFSFVLLGCQAEQILFFLGLEPNFLVFVNDSLNPLSINLNATCGFSL